MGLRSKVYICAWCYIAHELLQPVTDARLRSVCHSTEWKNAVVQRYWLMAIRAYMCDYNGWEGSLAVPDSGLLTRISSSGWKGGSHLRLFDTYVSVSWYINDFSNCSVCRISNLSSFFCYPFHQFHNPPSRIKDMYIDGEKNVVYDTFGSKIVYRCPELTSLHSYFRS